MGYDGAINGDTAAASAPWSDVSNADTGWVYLFQQDVGGADAWGQIARLTQTQPAAGDLFGFSLALSDDLALVGARQADDWGADAGAALLYARHQGGTNAWGQVARGTPSSGAAGDMFGHTVALEGRTLVVGAPYHDSQGANAGAVYLFLYNWPPSAQGDSYALPAALP